MKKIEHHLYGLPSKPIDYFESVYIDDDEYKVETVQEFLDGCSKNIGSGLFFDLFVRGLFLDKSKREVIRHLYDYQQVLLMKYKPYFNCEDNYSFTFRANEFSRKKNPLRAFLFSDWLKAFAVTIILRDPFDQIKDLVSISESMFIVRKDVGENDIDLVLYRLFQAFFGKSKQDIETLISDLIEYSSPEYIRDQEIQDYIYYIYLPLMQMLVYSQTSDRETKYPEKLLKAIESHYRYYTEKTSNGETLEYFIEGWLSLGITAMAAYAYDTSGLEPTVQTEYVPHWLVKGEFPTYEEAFPELNISATPEYKNFEFTASASSLDDSQWQAIIQSAIKWAKEEADLPMVCEVIGKNVESFKVDKNLQGEIFIDVLGNKLPELKLYSMEPCLIQGPDKWLNKMDKKWQDFILSVLPDAKASVYFT